MPQRAHHPANLSFSALDEGECKGGRSGFAIKAGSADTRWCRQSIFEFDAFGNTTQRRSID
jgi:hypothetical protein